MISCWTRLGKAVGSALQLSAVLGSLVGCTVLPAESGVEGDCEQGTLGCICYGNSSCNYHLSCENEVCVDNQAQWNAETSEAALLANDPLMSREAPDCITCAESDCSASLERCYETAGCSRLVGCLLFCARSSGHYLECSRDCYSDAPVPAYPKANGLQQCLNQTCLDECYPDVR